MRNVFNPINMLCFISTLPKKLSNSHCQAWQRGREMYKNTGDKKKEKGSLFLQPERKVCFLKTKTTSSHKEIYFKINTLYKIRICIFSLCLLKILNLR